MSGFSSLSIPWAKAERDEVETALWSHICVVVVVITGEP